MRAQLGLAPSELFIRPAAPADTGKGFTLAQKMVGKACGLAGVRPGTSCEPLMTTVGSQDTTGPMTRDEMKELACLGFSADLVLQSFCHTAAYPKPVDLKTHAELPDFMASRGGVALRPGDGIIHSWLNRMLLPDTVGTGGDSHTRFPLGISFPAGSGLVAFAAAIGAMPLDMPESVLVRFSGSLQPGVTLRDVVNAIPWVAIQKGLLTVEKANKKNVFSGRILEIEGLPDLKLEQAFELTDASAERSCAGCTIKLSEATVAEYLRSNVALLKNMIARGYHDERTMARRIQAMEAWLADPQLMGADADAEYAEIIEINLDDLTEPVLACPNDPDNVKLLSEVAGERIDEVFIGSCMTNIGHYRAAATVLDGAGTSAARLWVCPHSHGRRGAARRGLHRQVRGRRRPHGAARMLALHGQPGPGGRQHHRVLHQHPQLQQPTRKRRPGVSGQRRTGGGVCPAGPHSQPGRVPGDCSGQDRPPLRRALPLPQLRPDRWVQ